MNRLLTEYSSKTLFQYHRIKQRNQVNQVNGNEDRYDALLDHFSVAIMSIDFVGTINHVSTSFQKIIGYTKEEIIGQHYGVLFDKSDHQDLLLCYQEILRATQPHTCKLRLKRKNGELIWIELVTDPLFHDETGEFIETVTILKDISEDIETKQQLLNYGNLSLTGELAAGIAHEIRNPLTAIKGFLQLLEIDTSRKAYFNIIDSELKRIELILSEMLILAKPKVVEFKTENFISILEEVKLLIESQAILHNVRINIINKTEIIDIDCDKNQLKQVLINFLKNAIESISNDGTITIEVKKMKGKLQIVIHDSGPGFPNHVLEKMGKAFNTSKEKGTGLGVMISKQIIENHKGTVTFQNQPNGAMIEIVLPLANQK